MDNALVADIILFVHLLYALFVILGYFLIFMGYFFKWSFIRNRRLRLLHIAMIVFVGFEASIGMVCPLTSLEHYLRTGSSEAQRSFISRLVENLLFYDFPEIYFSYAYLFLSALAILLYFKIPPKVAKRKSNT